MFPTKQQHLYHLNPINAEIFVTNENYVLRNGVLIHVHGVLVKELRDAFLYLNLITLFEL